MAACTLAGVGPALAGDPPAGRERVERSARRDLHPEVSSGGETGAVAARLPSYLRGVSTSSGEVSWKIAPGITYTRWTQTDARGPIVAHLLSVKWRKRGIKIDYGGIGKVRQVAPVMDIVTKDKATVAVNGDFYDIGVTGAPLGLGLSHGDGLLHSRKAGWNSAFYLDAKGRPHIGTLPMNARVLGRPDIKVTNLNSPFVAAGGVGVYNADWGLTDGYRVTQGQKKHIRVVRVQRGKVVSVGHKLGTGNRIPGMLLIGRDQGARQLKSLKVGMKVRVGYHLEGRPQMAISGNQFLVNDGIIRVVDDTTLAPRTAVGIDDDTDEVLLLAVDGRSSKSRGYTMVELANLMIDLGADEAMNLDGGGSTTMVGQGRGGKTKVLNTPSDGFERWVANALEVTYTRP